MTYVDTKRKLNFASIKAQSDCRTVAEGYGVKIKTRRGKYWKAHCFNAEAHAHGDKSASLSLNREGYQCFGCGIKGDTLDLVASFEGISILEAAKLLAGEVKPQPKRLDWWQDFKAFAALQAKRRAQGQDPWAFIEGVTFGLTTATPTPSEAVPPPRARVEVPLPALTPKSAFWTQIFGGIFLTSPDPRLAAWCKRRGLHPQEAHYQGWRNTDPNAEAIAATLSRYSRAELVELGAAKRDRRGPAKLWWPLRAALEVARGKPRRHTGALIPVYGLDGHTIEGARWRHTDLDSPEAKVKAMAAPNSSGLPPLGYDSLSAACQDPYAKSIVVIVCEGETDFLAVHSAIKQLVAKTQPIAVLSHCIMQARWQRAWTEAMLHDPRITGIIIAFDRGKGDKPAGLQRRAEIVKQVAAIKGKFWASTHVKSAIRQEGCDLADLQAGGLLARLWLAPILDSLPAAKTWQASPKRLIPDEPEDALPLTDAQVLAIRESVAPDLEFMSVPLTPQDQERMI